VVDFVIADHFTDGGNTGGPFSLVLYLLFTICVFWRAKATAFNATAHFQQIRWSDLPITSINRCTSSSKCEAAKTGPDSRNYTWRCIYKAINEIHFSKCVAVD